MWPSMCDIYSDISLLHLVQALSFPRRESSPGHEVIEIDLTACSVVLPKTHGLFIWNKCQVTLCARRWPGCLTCRSLVGRSVGARVAHAEQSGIDISWRSAQIRRFQVATMAVSPIHVRSLRVDFKKKQEQKTIKRKRKRTVQHSGNCPARIRFSYIVSTPDPRAINTKWLNEDIDWRIESERERHTEKRAENAFQLVAAHVICIILFGWFG